MDERNFERCADKKKSSAGCTRPTWFDLIAALESLPHHYLQVILLRDFEDLTIAEMSEQLNESVATVKSRLHRARQMVREYLSTPS